MEEEVDIDQIIEELKAWLSCGDCGEMAFGTAYAANTPPGSEEMLSCGDCGVMYEGFAPDNSFAKTRDNLLQVAYRCKSAEAQVAGLLNELNKVKHG